MDMVFQECIDEMHRVERKTRGMVLVRFPVQSPQTIGLFPTIFEWGYSDVSRGFGREPEEFLSSHKSSSSWRSISL